MPSRLLVFASPLLVAVALGPVPTSAQGGRVVSYATPQACGGAGILTREECERAFRNAAAELDEKAPRFPKRDECEGFFRRCMIGLAGGGRRDVYFTPQMREVRIVAGFSDRTALPVLYADHPGLALAPRTIARPAEDVSRSRRAEAQARWTKRDEIEAAPAFSEPSDEEPAPSKPGEITSLPVPPHLRPKLIDNP